MFNLLFLFAIVLSVLLRFTYSVYPFGIFKLFLRTNCWLFRSIWVRPRFLLVLVRDCVVHCLHVFSCVLWCPRQFPHGNDVRFMFYSHYCCSGFMCYVFYLYIFTYKISISNKFVSFKKEKLYLLSLADRLL